MDECINHVGYTMPNGYGQVRRGGKAWLAHRWAAHVAHGPCPAGQVVRHKCDNRLCINSAHLEYGTQGDNLKDRRERHRYRKLTRADAESIKQDGRTLAVVAAEYGVSITLVHYIKSGKQWRDDHE